MNMPLLRTIAIIATAFAAAGFFIIFALFTTPHAVPAPALADILSADRTVVLGMQVNTSTLEQLQGILPAFPLPQLTAKPRTFAIVRQDDNRLGWVLDTGGDGANRFQKSDATLVLRSENEETLGNAEEFRALFRLAAEGEWWIYADLPALGASGTILNNLLAPDRPLAIASGSGGLRIAAVTAQNAPAHATFPPAFDQPSIMAELSSADILASIWPLLEEQRRMALSSLASTVTTSLLGSSISPRYDLFPLTQEPFHFSLQMQPDSPSLLAWQGLVAEEEADAAADLLHTSFVDALPLAAVRQRDLADGHRVQDVRIDTTTIKENTREEGAWTVRDTVMNNVASLHTAWGNGRLLVSNNAATLKRMQSIPTARLSGGILGRGIWTQPGLQRFWQFLMGEEVARPPLLQSGLQWELRQQGALMVLDLLRK